MKHCARCGNPDIYPMVHDAGYYFCEKCGSTSIYPISYWQNEMKEFKKVQLEYISMGVETYQEK